MRKGRILRAGVSRPGLSSPALPFRKIAFGGIAGDFQRFCRSGQIAVIFLVDMADMAADCGFQIVRSIRCNSQVQARRQQTLFCDKFRKVCFFQYAGTFQQVKKFTDVTREVILLQCLDLFRRKTAAVLFEPVTVGDRRDVRLVLPQRRNAD